jgi:DNA-binding transcriptional ArsR family regulator
MKLDEMQALDAFAALSQPTRLRMLRALVVAGRDGMAAGAVAEAVGASPSSASFHLSHLERAGLVASRREARSIVYAVSFDAVAGLVAFLMHDCCRGHPEVRAASAASVSC